MFYVTTVDNHGEALRSRFAKASDASEFVQKKRAEPRCAYIQVTIDHGRREPEEPGLAVVETIGCDWVVTNQIIAPCDPIPEHTRTSGEWTTQFSKGDGYGR